MKNRLGRVILLVHDYDEAFAFYRDVFGCFALHDSTTPEGQRYLHVGFSPDDAFGIWLLQATSGEQRQLVGRQSGGQPFLVVYTETFDELLENLRQFNVPLLGEPVSSPGARFVHCRDLYGNEIIVVQLIP
ncbi:VOC family protein [Siphonobacter aquaeclarae]|jgi:predicted enzyme related to lactoylglutathione lyase|uniref:VOC domain-containing protein n=1 Tax=Siphonobacter aquaeclarae TaxID=563176 RepID=A0A1G9HYZ8_9BACT|nr:VOC family protein [Siphonobacter aquaeclarae]MBO9638806.1 VOC family protein [Siphonobacter aquaeclarae]SDL18198.1 hypothetical protein SAMN04488090_0268 [Siphonobacter aquaeclarae]